VNRIFFKELAATLVEFFKLLNLAVQLCLANGWFIFGLQAFEKARNDFDFSVIGVIMPVLEV
jgi:hypothetical protein